MSQALSTLDSSVDKPSPAPAEQSRNLSAWDRLSFSISHAFVSGLLMLLSPGGLYRFGRMFGTLEWLLNHKRRKRFGKVLRRVFDHKPTASERRRITREFFMNVRCDKLFYLVFDRLPTAKASALFTIEGQDLLDAALARGRGVYLAMSHHGPHHVLAMLLAVRGYKPACVRDGNEGALRRFVQDRFDRRYPDFPRMRVLYSDSYPREVYRCLTDGYVLGSAMDVNQVRHAHQRAEEVHIFGETRAFLSGPLRIALRCRTPVLQAFVVPTGGFRYRLEIAEQLLDPETAKDDAPTITTAMTAYADNLETYVRRWPSLMTRV